MKNQKGLLKKDSIAGYLFILPLLIYFFVFLLSPMLISLFYSFTQWNMRTDAQFVGFQNYKDLLFNRLLYPKFWISLGVTLRYILLELPASLMISLLLALLLNKGLKGTNTFRAIFYIPVVTSGVAVAAMWKWIYDSHSGLLNMLLSLLPNGEFLTHSWLNEVGTALPAMAAMAVWGGLGFKILIFLAGLKTIPGELYEAATIDGANDFQKFIKITIPVLAPTTFFLVITGFIGSFQVFDQMYLLTNGTGGPNDSTLSYVLSLYQHAFRYSEMGIASAMSYILFIIILIVTMINFKLLPQKVD
ncbi:MAG: sugar ABC transporter permease [Spirochaetaceae bacterium]|jgi:multiple sugar transport system permease protein|nr:sugar ABC transporter permease [Spirochaetaceae bacterium]